MRENAVKAPLDANYLEIMLVWGRKKILADFEKMNQFCFIAEISLEHY